MKLILTEKPSAARNFAKALGGKTGTYEGQDYRIESLVGHVLELAPPAEQVDEDLAEQYAKWKLENIPWNIADLAFKRQVNGDVKDVIDNLAEALSEIDEVVIATDVDPSGEGELLAWEALDWCKWAGPTYRMYFMDEAPASIQKAFIDMKPIESMERDGDYVKAWTRQRWDFLSMQFTRIASIAAQGQGFNQVVRQGRLKSVMVDLVGKQLDAVKNYKRTPFYVARFKDANGNVFSRKDEEEFKTQTPEEIDLGVYQESEVIEDSREIKHKAPGKLLDLSALSAILATKGYKPKDVLSTYQKMYEEQIVSYPRTEDKVVTPEQFNELLPLTDKIAALVGVNNALLTHKEPRTTHVKEGGAHGANRPGPRVPDSLEFLAKYGKEGPEIYKTLALNWLAILAEDYEYEHVKGHVKDYPEFIGSTNIPLKPGFKAVFDAEVQAKDAKEDEEQANSQEFASPAAPFVHKGANKKPQKPTMKWLTKALEKYNVGTGATRTSTLADITATNNKALLIEKKGALTLAPCGEVSYKLLDGCLIASPEVTEKLFNDMEAVGRFELSDEVVLASINELIVHDKAKMLKNAGEVAGMQAGVEVVGQCLLCGEDVVLRTSKTGAKWLNCTSNKAEKNEDGTFSTTGGCGFKMSAKFYGKTLTPSQLGKILAGDRIAVNGLKSKKGTTYGAYATIGDLVPDENGWYNLHMDGFVQKKKK